MRVLVYVRPWSMGYFRLFAGEAFQADQVSFVSDFRGLGEHRLSERFHEIFDSRPAQVRWPDWFSAADEYEVIARSYLLRSLPVERARRMVAAMSQAIGEIFASVRPDAFLSLSSDSYVLDLFGRWAAATGGVACGLIPCPFPGYTRVTTRGEYTAFRDVSDEEARAALARVVDPAFRPVDLVEWLKTYGPWLAAERALREKPKPFYFWLMGHLKRDRLNYHYLSSAVSRVSFVSQGLLVERHFDRDWRQTVAAWRGRKLYFPLQAYPESTTDLHVPQLELIDFHGLLYRILDRLQGEGDILVVVKEHPGMMGARPPGFYEPLLRLRNAVLVSGGVPGLDVLESCDTVLTWTGTGGLEAGLRGKPVITIGPTYYTHGSLYRTVTGREQVESIPDMVREAGAIVADAEAPVAIAKRVLASCVPGEFRYVAFDKASSEVREEARAFARSVRQHWDDWAAAFPASYRAHLAASARGAAAPAAAAEAGR